MSQSVTEQESFWVGDFGDEYSQRNRGDEVVASNLAMFSTILTHTQSVQSVLELGPNIGMNLRAFKQLLPQAALAGVEINQLAVEELGSIEGVTAYHQSILDFEPQRLWDFVFTRGVLIHINPESLSQVYNTLYRCSRRYICVAEYYNPAPVELDYRGHGNRLFKRDFAGELLDRFADLSLVDYGFTYHRDPFPQDDITWFLLKRTEPTED